MADFRGRARGALTAALLGAALSLSGAGCSNDAGPAVPVDPAVMYAQNCARCHGANGHGDPEIKKTMPNVRDFSDPTFLAKAQTDDLVRTIMAGKGQMPAFGASLSLPKMQSLSGYVRRLGRTATP
ncbi:MAG TPA: c-type cytochrome [Polyangia bacterium]|nr:c-type cytochrome [Polyangia bacterium]